MFNFILAGLNYWDDISISGENAEILKENIVSLDKILKPIFANLEAELVKYPDDFYFTKFKNELLEASKLVHKDWVTWEDWDNCVKLLFTAVESAPHPFKDCISFC